MEVIGAFAPKRPSRKADEFVCLREVHAELFTLGGAIAIAICFVLTVAAYIVWQGSQATGLQSFVLIAMTVGAWLYFLDSITERLRLVDHSLEFSALFSRRRIVPLADLDAMLLIYQGFNLEHGIESVELRRRGQKPDRIALGPCWQHHKLEAFLGSVEQALRDPDLVGAQ